MIRESSEQIAKLYKVAVYEAYQSVCTGDRAPVNTERYLYMTASPQPGDLIMETSTIWHDDRDLVRVGFLDRTVYEHRQTDEEWETEKRTCFEKTGIVLDDVGDRIKRQHTYIKLLFTGTEYRWHNAGFIRVPQELKRWI